MKVKNYQGGTLIILSEAFDSRDKTLFFFYFLVFFVTGLFSMGASLNRLAFDYEGRTIQFGKDIYSWDFDEIKQLLNPPA
jgi:hypothetical protein